MQEIDKFNCIIFFNMSASITVLFSATEVKMKADISFEYRYSTFIWIFGSDKKK
jgi:hypothetical protein